MLLMVVGAEDEEVEPLLTSRAEELLVEGKKVVMRLRGGLQQQL
jgi:hypothetical protein